MNPYRMATPPRSWAPKLSPAFVRLARPFRQRRRIKEQQLVEVEIRGARIVADAIAAGQGVLITPNHSTHADPYTMYAAADQIGTPFYFMATWHVFDSEGRLGQWALQRHGCFSIDREGADLQAFKQAVKIVRNEPQPLVIFPEGEVYHCNERITPFREGPAAIALSAAKHAKRPIVCIPCSLNYKYVDDPMDDLLVVMSQLERQIHWRPRPDRPLSERIYAFGEAVMALKEIEFLGHATSGTLPERTDRLACKILSRIEQSHGIDPGSRSIPERVKELRRRTIAALDEEASDNLDHDEVRRKQLNDVLDDLFLVVQLFSYPGDYVAERPSLERMAETLDKFEEDVLGKYSATIRGRRRVTVTFGEPIAVESGSNRKTAAQAITETLEMRVQEMLDAHMSG